MYLNNIHILSLSILSDLILATTTIASDDGKFDPYFKTTLVDQSFNFNSADTASYLTTFFYYTLPPIEHYDSTDTITTSLSEGFNNNFMAFDKSMNKFIFNGFTVASVGVWVIRIDL